MAQSGELIESADLRGYSRGSLFFVDESQAAITKRERFKFRWKFLVRLDRIESISPFQSFAGNHCTHGTPTTSFKYKNTIGGVVVKGRKGRESST